MSDLFLVLYVFFFVCFRVLFGGASSGMHVKDKVFGTLAH